MRAILEIIPGIARTAGPDGRADCFNRRWLDYTGMSPVESAERGWMAAVDPDDLPEVESR